MLNAVYQDVREKMKKTVDATAHDFSSLRTGRASPALVESLKVDYYGTMTPLQQIASISAPDARTLEIKPWDKGALAPIAKAITVSKLGLNPVDDGKIIRISIPSLTEERRKELVKVAKEMTETHRVAIRNERREAIEKARELHKKKQITDDEMKKAEGEIQKLTDEHVKKIDDLAAGKEKEILTV